MKKRLILIVLIFLFSGQAYAAVDINTATQAELETLQGIGPAKAKAIIEYREKNGSFTSIEGLAAVSGIGPGTMKQLGDSITVGNSQTVETAVAVTSP
ncbi:MAG: helix-hairpin-helix domain-containing protein [Nitrosomonas sp.]|nr:helix-hairpin-helix domain-containing protein [Nitrosomonas sp.]MCW5607213.1 helix-hairpin-helix domain-containing protein [Nitrosomonas sp.]